LWTEALCTGCQYNRAESEPPRWLHHIAWIRTVLSGGYPARAEDLSLEVWYDLGELAEHIATRRAAAR
jgi:hypothetical protein